MRKYLVIMMIFASCAKDAVNRPANTEPSITNYTFKSVHDGGGERPQFTVKVVSDSNVVAKLELIRGSFAAWEVIKPVTKTYIMYDHIIDYPTYVQQIFYHFSFLKKDGTRVNLPPFQVY